MNSPRVPKILVLDDEADLVEILEFHLRQQKLFTVGFTDPVLAEAEILKGGISLVLLDLNMPQRSGLELMRNARLQGIDIPFVFLTGSDEIKDFQDIGQLGAFAMLSKPFDIPEILKTILQALETRKESP